MRNKTARRVCVQKITDTDLSHSINRIHLWRNVKVDGKNTENETTRFEAQKCTQN